MYIEKWISEMAAKEVPANSYELSLFAQKVINEYRATCDQCGENPCECKERNAWMEEQERMFSLYKAEVKYGIHIPEGTKPELMPDLDGVY